MALDSYSPCPCGSGKKLKFCCSDLSGELAKLARMIEGQQYAAALEQVERDEAKYPGRAALLAIKVQLLRALEEFDRAKEAIETFRRECPDNALALAESAIQKAFEGDAATAMSELQKSLEQLDKQMFPQVYDAFSILASVMAQEGQIRSARALLQYQSLANPEDKEPLERMSRLFASRGIPALMKTDPKFLDIEEGVAIDWKADYEKAVEKIISGRWAAGERMLVELIERVGDHLVLWQNVATLRGWLGDSEGASIAWAKAASLTDNQEDAVEYLATSRILLDDPLDDTFESLKATFMLKNADELVAALTMWKQSEQVPFDPRRFEEGQVPPKAVFWLLDREILKDATDIRLETLPRVCGQALVFGRQTDREARLELFGVAKPRFAALSAALKSVGPDYFDEKEPEFETLAKISATFDLLDCPWKLPDRTTSADYRKIVTEYTEWAMLERWPQMRLGFLDGKTPTDAAQEPAYQTKLLAAILVVETLAVQARKPFDFNRLREKLGLPILGPIDPTNLEVAEISLVRLGRLEVEKMTNEQIESAYVRALLYSMTKESVLFGKRLLDLPGIDLRRRQHILLVLAQQAESSDEALEFIDRGSLEAEGNQISTAPWKLTELKIRIARQEKDEVLRLIRDLEGSYSKDPSIMNALAQILYESGLLTPPEPSMEQMAQMQEEAAEEVGGGIWTPDGGSSSSGDETSGGGPSKLWVPDMD